jgi:Holliday junction resolvasome RuvABC endonuclease subunit
MGKYLISCDCATHIFGWAIINKKDFTLVDYGEIHCDKDDVMERTNYMVDELQKIVKKTDSRRIKKIQELFIHNNKK